MKISLTLIVATLLASCATTPAADAALVARRIRQLGPGRVL